MCLYVDFFYCPFVSIQSTLEILSSEVILEPGACETPGSEAVGDGKGGSLLSREITLVGEDSLLTGKVTLQR